MSKIIHHLAGIKNIKNVLYQAQLAFMKVLEGYTLADVISNPVELQALLHIK